MANPLEAGGANRAEAAKCLAMIIDVNGAKKPNTYGKDVIAINAQVGCAFILNNKCFDAPNNTFPPIKYDECMADPVTTGHCCDAYYCTNGSYESGAIKYCGGIDKMMSSQDGNALASDVYNTVIDGNYNYGVNMSVDKALKYGFGNSTFRTYVYDGHYVYSRDCYENTTSQDSNYYGSTTGIYALCVNDSI